MQKKAQLILLPNVLSEGDIHLGSCFTQEMISEVPTLTGLIAESEKGGRYFLKRFPFPEGKTFRDVQIRVLSEHTRQDGLDELISLIKPAEKWGLISDAGLPCLADPGAKLVYLARRKGIDVSVHMGPSSIVMALMLSGLGAQKFCFEGYLPKEASELTCALKAIQQRSVKEGSTHVFIETPYRSHQMLEKLISVLDDKMKLSISCDLTLPTQEVYCYTIKEWKKANKPELQKRLVVFVISA